jgi:pilus assembly protein CpaF
MDAKELLELQTQRGAKVVAGTDKSTKSLEAVINECRKIIEEQSDKYRELPFEDKRERIRGIIVDYVMSTKPLVKGYIDSGNTPDILKLVDKLVEDITDYGILTAAMINDDVFEIRGNGKEIKVEIKGHVHDYLDKDGNIISFDSVEQQEIIIRKLLGDVRLTPKDRLVNGSTIEGFRIAAVHSSAMGQDPNDPLADKYHAFVLRKFKKSKMSLSDIVKFETLSDNMARLLALCTAGGLAFFTVGPTASGKTTTNNAILQSVPPKLRTILLQNPSEIDLRFKDSSGRVYNDVLHLEAEDSESSSNKDNTLTNTGDHILRLSPTLVGLGEIRANSDFKQAMKILLAGHPLNSTYHAESTAGAIMRFLSAYLSESGNEPYHLALGTLTSLLDIVIVQKILPDGRRRIIQISEIEGVDENNRDVPKINDLYVFDTEGTEPDYNTDGSIAKINGVHKRVGKISKNLVSKMRLVGVSSKRCDFLLKPVDENEVETYTGLDIEKYGLPK